VNVHHYEGWRVGTVADITDPAEVYATALSLSGLQEFDHVITPLERCMIPAGMVRSGLGIQGMKYDQALGFANKFIMKKRIAQAGIPAAKFKLLPDGLMAVRAGQILGWPLVVKPLVGSGSQSTFWLRSARDAEELVGRTGTEGPAARPMPMLAEQAMSVTAEFHCDGIVRDGQVLFYSVSQYFSPLIRLVGDFIGSFILDSGHPLHAEIGVLHHRSVDALGLVDGVTHLEVLRTRDGLLFGEIACRPGGAGIPSNIARKHGIDLWEAFLSLGLGRQPTVIGNHDASPGSRSGEVIQAWLGLPARNGRITAMAPVADFLAIPAVQDVEMLYAPGEEIAGSMATGFFAGCVFFTGQDDADVYRIAQRISSAYYIQTESADGVRRQWRAGDFAGDHNR
jgi:biotin carboxylase